MNILEAVGFIFVIIVCYPLMRLTLGILICYRNFLIFHLLKKKIKKTSTDDLVLCNLLSDGLYGLQLIISVILYYLPINATGKKDERNPIMLECMNINKV